MIGGIIILTLFLSALSVMVFISQQYDKYQSTVETMNRKDIDAFSENLVAVFPGLTGGNLTSGGLCPSGCVQYTLLVSNHAAIGTQIARIYINSTGAGCTNLCILDSASVEQPFHFLASSAFVNPSEYSHQLILYLNTTSTFTLPTAYGSNTVALVTARGRAFSFQFPFPPNGINAMSYLTTGTMKIAYQPSQVTGGYASSNEPAAIAAGSGGTAVAGYCHNEPAGQASKITGTTYGTLWFVNPWVTKTIFYDALPSGIIGNHTNLYVIANLTNNQASQITITGGNIWLELITVPPTPPTLLVMGGPLIGTYYPASSGGGSFYAAGSSPQVNSGQNVLLIYRITSYNWGGGTYLTGTPSDMTFAGMATMTNKLENGGYIGGTTTLDGLYVRPSC
jgi:hypothetical protein